MFLSMKAVKTWKPYRIFFNSFNDFIITMLTTCAERIHKDCEQEKFYKDLMKATTKERFTEALVGNLLVDILIKYREDHPCFVRGYIGVDEKDLHKLDALLDHAIAADEDFKKGKIQ